MGLIKTSEQITLPDDADHWIQFRQPTKRQLDAAFDAKRESLDGVRRRLMDNIKASGRDPMAELERLRNEAMAAGAKVEQPGLLEVYDASTVVDSCVHASSYGEALGPKPADSLEPQTVEWAALQILEMANRPPANAPATSGS